MGTFIDRTGRRYGRLVVVGRAPNKGSRVRWKCVCDCGAVAVVTGHELSAGDTQSCGCIHKEVVSRLNRSHGMSRTPTYRSWQAMRERCGNTHSEKFPSYGAKGIKVCARWSVFENFLADMGERPAGKTLDRIDPYGDYTPENCRWATAADQGNNKRSNVLFRGERMSIKAISKAVGVPRTSLNKAYLRIGDIEEAVRYCIARKK